MTNPCFQDTEFAKVMKGKHVMNAWVETMVESVGEVSGSDKESINDEENNESSPGNDNGSVNDEVNPIDPIAILLSHPSVTVPGGRISVRLRSAHVSTADPNLLMLKQDTLIYYKSMREFSEQP
jgi:hypothetical protein